MKAFVLYPKDERALRQVLRKLQDLGTLNCSFEPFNKCFVEWHEKAFPRENWQKYNPNIPYRADPTTSLLYRNDWFDDFIEFLANYEI